MKKLFWLLIFSSGLTFALGTQESTNNSGTVSLPSSTPEVHIKYNSTHDSHGGNGSQDQNSHGGNEEHNPVDDHEQGNQHHGNKIEYAYI